MCVCVCVCVGFLRSEVRIIPKACAVATLVYIVREERC